MHRIDKIRSICQHKALDEALSRQAEGHNREPHNPQPQMPAGKFVAPEPAANDSRPNIVERSHCPQCHSPKGGEMRMGNDKIIKVGHLLNSAQSLYGPLGGS